MTQHLHFGFFLITTCSTAGASLGGTITLWCTSTTPGATFWSFGVLPFAPDFGLFATGVVLFGVITTSCTSLPLGEMGPVSKESVWSWCNPLPTTPSSSGSSPLIGVIGLPSLMRLTIVSASRAKSPSGRKGLSTPLSWLKRKKNKMF